MALEQGSVSLRRFFPAQVLPKSRDDIWFEKLNEHRLREMEELKPDSENGGWAVLGNELSTEFNVKNVVIGPYVMFAYRRDTLKLPAGLVELHMKAHMAVEKEFGEGVGKQKRQQMKDDIVQDLLEKTLPNIETAGVLVDTSRQVLYFCGSNEKLTDEFLTLFYKCWNVQLVESDWETTAHRLLDNEKKVSTILKDPGLYLVKNLEIHPEFQDEAHARLGSSFLTWLYYFLQTTESVWASEEIEEIGVYVDDSLTLAGETYGSREITIKKGFVSTCRELAAAFAAGKAVSKMRLNFLRGDEEEGQLWSFGLDKRNLQMQGLKCPKSEEVDAHTALMERFDSIAEIHDILDDMVRDFLQLRISPEWPEILEEMRQWIGHMDGADQIWEAKTSLVQAIQKRETESELDSDDGELDSNDSELDSDVGEFEQPIEAETSIEENSEVWLEPEMDLEEAPKTKKTKSNLAVTA
jgi:recombination associated protein RdgC